jgi:predicted regulator of Ras-like GTPase activity (Roadblock/LC7/MglB family)
METSLQSLLEQAGVNAAMVLDGAGRLVGQRGRAVYDRALCEQVGGALARAIDSIQLQHDDWEVVTAHFADGTILMRNLGAVAGASYVLAVVADATLNPAFAAVALRVAANKVRKALEGGGGSRPVLTGSAVSAPPAQGQPGPSGSQALPPAPTGGGGSRPVLASSGLSWSRTFGSGMAGVMAADPATSAWLGKVARELARSVGPMAKLFIEEGIRRVSPDQPFGQGQAKALLEDLAQQIEDPADRAAFTKAALALKP